MTNDERRMTKEAQIPNAERCAAAHVVAPSFALLHFLAICHSPFVICIA
jgi:hypothetical protein